MQEFRAARGRGSPEGASRLSLCFDKLDVERGIDGIRGPEGETRSLQATPGACSRSSLPARTGSARSMPTASRRGARDPARRAAPRSESPGPDRSRAGSRRRLILVDEVLMYAREKAGLDPVWRGADRRLLPVPDAGRRQGGHGGAGGLCCWPPSPRSRRATWAGGWSRTSPTCSGGSAKRASSRCRRATCRKCCAGASSSRPASRARTASGRTSSASSGTSRGSTRPRPRPGPPRSSASSTASRSTPT